MVLALRFNSRLVGRRRREGKESRRKKEWRKPISSNLSLAEGESDERAFKVLRASEPTLRYAKQRRLVYGDKGAELPSFLPSFLRRCSVFVAMNEKPVLRGKKRRRKRKNEEIRQVREEIEKLIVRGSNILKPPFRSFFELLFPHSSTLLRRG